MAAAAEPAAAGECRRRPPPPYPSISLGPFNHCHRACDKDVSSVAGVLISSLRLSRFRSSVGSKRGSITGTHLARGGAAGGGFGGPGGGRCRSCRRRRRRPELAGQQRQGDPPAPPARSVLPVFDSSFHSGHPTADNCDADFKLDRSGALAGEAHALTSKNISTAPAN